MKSFYLFNPCLHSFHVQKQETMERRKKWKQFLSQLCYCLQNNIREGNFLFHPKLPFSSSVWLSVLHVLLFASNSRQFYSRSFSFQLARQTSRGEEKKYLFSPSIDTHAVHFILLLLFYFVNIFGAFSLFMGRIKTKLEMAQDMDSGTFKRSLLAKQKHKRKLYLRPRK